MVRIRAVILRMLVRALFSCLFLVLAAPQMPLAYSLPLETQGVYQWSKPELIPDYNNMLNAPYLVADQNRTVHAFDLESTGTRQYAIMYRRWTLSQSWSSPVDILLPEFLGVAPTFNGVFLGQDGILHLIYFAGDQDKGDLYYSRAYVAEVDSAHAWSKPVVVAQNAGPVPAASIVENREGNLIIVYGGQREGIGVYETHSPDGGDSWSVPSVVTILDKPELWPTSIRLESDSMGRVHTVWHTSNSIGQGDEIYYARLDSNLAKWDGQTVLARRDTERENMGWASIISSGDELIVVYQDSFPATKWMRRSSDGGDTWATAVRPFFHVGGYEYVSLLKDSAERIHMVLGNRYPSPEIHGMWYSRLEGNQWAPLQPIISGPSTSSFDPCCPRAVIGQGNILLATWPHNVVQEFLTGAWYSYTILDAPELPVVPLPTSPAAALTPTASLVPLMTAVEPTLTVRPEFDGLGGIQPEPSSESNPADSIFVGIAPVVAFVLVAIVYRFVRRGPHEAKSRKE